MNPASRIALFDAHLHIIDPWYPIVPNHGYLPPPFTVADYLNRLKDHRLVGGAVVSGSFQAFDQSYLYDALRRLGPGFVAVTQLPADVDDAQVLELDRIGVRAVRFNVQRGGSASMDHLEALALRVHELAGWHVELYADAVALASIEARLHALPAVSIDHLGLSAEGLPVLLRLVERGVRVKATGFGRLDFDVRSALRDLCSANPEGIMFGTDLPGTRAPRPYADVDFELVVDCLDERQALKVLCTNAVDWYRPRRREVAR